MKKAHCCTLAPLGYFPLWLPLEMVMSLKRRDTLSKDPQFKIHHKDHGPLMSLELPTRNDLVPRCCLYDDSPFEMLRYPYMLPSMTIDVPYDSLSNIQR